MTDTIRYEYKDLIFELSADCHTISMSHELAFLLMCLLFLVTIVVATTSDLWTD